MNPARTIGILEDDAALRRHLASQISASDALKVVAEAGTLKEALELYETAPADLWLVDINLPDGSGADFIRAQGSGGSTRNLILTILGDRESVLVALRAGADGYLLKDTPAAQLCDYIVRTLDGETPISPKVAKFLLEAVQIHAWGGIEPVTDAPQLSARELDILRLFSKGLSYAEAAEALGVSRHTVGDYVKTIYKAMSVHSRAEALFEARQMGLLDHGD